MEIVLKDNFNQQNIRTACSIGLAGLGAICGKKLLTRAGVKINRKISLKAVEKVRKNNEVYKKASLEVLRRENIQYADLSVTRDAFTKGADPEFDKAREKESKKIINILNSYVTSFLGIFRSKKKEQQYYSGINACIGYNKVFANFEKGAFMVPHEIGHIKNFQGKGIGYILQTLRGSVFTKPAIGLAYAGAILIPPQKDEESGNEEQKLSAKTKKAIKNNCVLIGAAAALPSIIEEGLASLKANNLMKGVLPKSDLKAMNRANFGAFLSYLFSGAAMVGGIYIADKIRNYTANKKQTKNQLS